MAGHSHSSNIKFRKDRVDAKRARAFAKLSRMIPVAARQGGGSLDGNAKLRLVVDKARLVSMPKDGIDRAIKKGPGESDLGNYEEIVYEGYGPGGVALVQREVPLREATLAYVPTTRIEVNETAAAQRLGRLIDALEDHEDVQAVFRNETFPDRVVQELDAGA